MLPRPFFRSFLCACHGLAESFIGAFYPARCIDDIRQEGASRVVQKVIIIEGPPDPAERTVNGC